MERDLKIATGVSSDLSGEAGIYPGELLVLICEVPSHTSFLGICCTHFTQQKGGLLKAALKTQALKGLGGKRGEILFNSHLYK